MSFSAIELTGSKPEQYAQLLQQARALLHGERDRIANAANLSALVYNALPGLNWVGFYFFDGTELGRLHPASTLLVDSGDRPVAGIMVNVRLQDPPWGGPWIADIWRDPSLRGETAPSIPAGRAGSKEGPAGVRQGCGLGQRARNRPQPLRHGV